MIATQPLHENNYGLVWEEWYGSGGGRRIVRKEHVFYGERAWRNYLDKVASSPDLHRLLSGWTPQEELTSTRLHDLTSP